MPLSSGQLGQLCSEASSAGPLLLRGGVVAGVVGAGVYSMLRCGRPTVVGERGRRRRSQRTKELKTLGKVVKADNNITKKQPLLVRR